MCKSKLEAIHAAIDRLSRDNMIDYPDIRIKVFTKCDIFHARVKVSVYDIASNPRATKTVYYKDDGGE